MKFFNVDLHVSVIEDVAHHLRARGHVVDSHLLSGHWWALDREPAKLGTGESPVGYKSLNLKTWEQFFLDVPMLAKVRAWQEECPELNEYDAFIATYPPAFAMLFDRFPGHVIVDIPVRYDLHVTDDPNAWRTFNHYLVDNVNLGKMTVLANSLYDAAYYQHFTGQRCRYIPSTCSYVDRLTPKWSPTGQKLLSFGSRPGAQEAAAEVPGVHFVRDVLATYQHAEIVKARGFVWIPYTSSVMSFFEHYWLEVPLFVPSQKFLMELYDRGLALDTLSWHRDLTGGSNLPRVGGDMPDPHTRAGVEAWLPLYDFYNHVEFPHVVYFDSWVDLVDKIATTSFESVSRAMQEQNAKRLARHTALWDDVLARVATWNTR